jgi:hypothetical protein
VVGFPPLPDELWEQAAADPRTTHAGPRPLNKVVPDFRVSLARAVRLSSNFPFGFRVSEAAPPEDGLGPLRRVGRYFVPVRGGGVHMLDGGVVDNTGLDTIYELFKGLERHAKSDTSGYQAPAHNILQGLRQRGVVLLEIDSGAKPSPAPPWPLDPLGGSREPLQALDNASYTNAEVIKKLYVQEVQQVLRPLQGLWELGPEASGALAPLDVTLAGAKPVHLTIQCNHYLPDERARDPEVMTAWALGPLDKAQVVQRFLINLEVWDQQRRDAYRDVQSALRKCTAVERDARKQALLAVIPGLLRRYNDLLAVRDVQGLRRRQGRLKKRLDWARGEVALAADPEVNDNWERLLRTADRVERQLAEASRPPAPGWRPLAEAVQEARKQAASLAGEYDYARARATESKNEEVFKSKVKAQGALPDVQGKYDFSARRTKVLERQ